MSNKELFFFPAHKRIRKPSKRLIEWTEEYDQIFSTRKKTKKPLQLIGKVKKKKKQGKIKSVDFMFAQHYGMKHSVEFPAAKFRW